ncbi:unnamed protein product [Microthlaspi erraticum]|uniref:Uncharacterized protein n=1 Tax=Microthlaspi erraticum TaxID=1685480 RepID=A0A6D2KYG9_9BRAS|nr:unnamed protein product [Microthlaspi erraticum]
MDQQEEKAGKTEPKELDRVQRSIEPSTTSSIDPFTRTGRSMPLSIECVQEELDRPINKYSIDPMQSRASSIDPVLFSRSINPGQMISQPFDLLGANRLDRTTANRIEPKSTPELFRPIFSHCLGYAVFQSLHCCSLFPREKRSNLVFTVWRRFLNPCFSIFIFDSMNSVSVIVCCFIMSE